MPYHEKYDCVVLGGGPAGTTAATLVARSGFATLLVEREKMPRFHVGESLMPETYWTLQRLGVLDRMRESDFVKKYSVQFVSGNGRESEPFFFNKHDDSECSQTWQVERARFDQMLFENAAANGAECMDETRVLRVALADQRATGVVLRDQAGQEHHVHSKVVMDATGQQALIANQLGLRVPIPELRKAAIWTYYRDAQRLTGEHGGATLVLHTKGKSSWFWYIPLSNNITSVGVVADQKWLFQGEAAPADVFEAEKSRCPALQRRLQNAQRVNEYQVAREFSYSTRQHAGDGWVLVGDAFGFIDPIYSSGVFFALKTGELAADCVIEGLQQDDLSRTQLEKWTAGFNSGARWVRKLVDVFYKNEFSFGQFARNHPEHLGQLTDILIGRIFDRDMEQVFQDIENMQSQS